MFIAVNTKCTVRICPYILTISLWPGLLGSPVATDGILFHCTVSCAKKAYPTLCTDKDNFEIYSIHKTTHHARTYLPAQNYTRQGTTGHVQRSGEECRPIKPPQRTSVLGSGTYWLHVSNSGFEDCLHTLCSISREEILRCRLRMCLNTTVLEPRKRVSAFALSGCTYLGSRQAFAGVQIVTVVRQVICVNRFMSEHFRYFVCALKLVGAQNNFSWINCYISSGVPLYALIRASRAVNME